jgi:hypothetical protein
MSSCLLNLNLLISLCGGGGAVDRRPLLRCANVLNHSVHVQQTRSSSAFTRIHVVCGICKVNVVKNASPKHVQYTGNHPCYYKVSYFEFLKSLVQKSKKRPISLQFPSVFPRTVLSSVQLVCATIINKPRRTKAQSGLILSQYA